MVELVSSVHEMMYSHQLSQFRAESVASMLAIAIMANIEICSIAAISQHRYRVAKVASFPAIHQHGISSL